MVSKVKPKLTLQEKRLLRKKVAQSRKRPEFRRQEWFRYVKLGESWRKPRGKHSKLREKLSRRPPNVDAGYRGPASVRGLHPSGFKEKLVYNVSDLSTIDREKEAARISSTVGARKREMIENRADELGIRVLNPSPGEEK
ncbi:MAG: 50S ribosomal protein L32e [Candidatus Thermoplasmatota archaeon]|nr:50S ribosomal protein L32e [Candidatus Thermoplasmatota archaeon]